MKCKQAKTQRYYISNLNVSEWNIIEAADGELSLDPELVDL